MKKLFLMILFCLMVAVSSSYGRDTGGGFGDHFSGRDFGKSYDGHYGEGYGYPFLFRFSCSVLFPSFLLLSALPILPLRILGAAM
jgi:hypothetical protein